MLVLVRSFCYTPKASFSEKFQNQNIFITLVRCFPDAPSGSFKVDFFFFFFYTPLANFSEVFLLHISY